MIIFQVFTPPPPQKKKKRIKHSIRTNIFVIIAFRACQNLTEILLFERLLRVKLRNGICTRQLSNKKRTIYGEWHMQQRMERKAIRFQAKSCTSVCEQKRRCFRHTMSFDFRLKRSIINLSITGRHVSFIANITGGFYRNSKQVYAFAYSCDSGSYKYTLIYTSWCKLNFPCWNSQLILLQVDNPIEALRSQFMKISRFHIWTVQRYNVRVLSMQC